MHNVVGIPHLEAAIYTFFVYASYFAKFCIKIQQNMKM